MTAIYDMWGGKWSDLQKECYARNCICRGCEYNKYSTKCMVKNSLIDKIRIFGLESGVETKKWLQT